MVRSFQRRSAHGGLGKVAFWVVVGEALGLLEGVLLLVELCAGDATALCRVVDVDHVLHAAGDDILAVGRVRGHRRLEDEALLNELLHHLHRLGVDHRDEAGLLSRQ